MEVLILDWALTQTHGYPPRHSTCFCAIKDETRRTEIARHQFGKIMNKSTCSSSRQNDPGIAGQEQGRRRPTYMRRMASVRYPGLSTAPDDAHLSLVARMQF